MERGILIFRGALGADCDEDSSNWEKTYFAVGRGSDRARWRCIRPIRRCGSGLKEFGNDKIRDLVEEFRS